MAKFKSGVAFGNQAWDILNEAKAQTAALPAVNVTGSNTINAALEAARDVNSPIIIQLSHGGSAFMPARA
jgi:fructose-bisphosphate aldolase class II